jgi:hypothetical protein
VISVHLTDGSCEIFGEEPDDLAIANLVDYDDWILIEVIRGGWRRKHWLRVDCIVRLDMGDEPYNPELEEDESKDEEEEANHDPGA